VLLKRKRGEPNGCTHDQDGIEEGGTGHTQDTSPKGGQQTKGRDFGDIEDGGTGRKQDASPKGGRQTKGRDFGAQACVDDRPVTAYRHLEASGRVGRLQP
jgi:hypothetical protein